MDGLEGSTIGYRLGGGADVSAGAAAFPQPFSPATHDLGFADSYTARQEVRVRGTLVAVVGLAALTSGCAAPFPMHGRPYASLTRGAASPDVTGRWDNVMMLAPGSRVMVLLMDGARADGDIVSASNTGLTLRVAAGSIEVSADTVARVDRAGASRLQSGVSGAAHALGAVGVISLLAGKAPPARVFAGAAVAGAEAGIHANQYRGVETIYLARGVRR